MKRVFSLLVILFLTSTTTQNPPIQILQINAEWNQHNDVSLKIPKDYNALLENQGPGFKKSFAGKPLPIVVLRVGGNMKYQWTADLSFKLNLTDQEVLSTINKVLKLK